MFGSFLLEASLWEEATEVLEHRRRVRTTNLWLHLVSHCMHVHIEPFAKDCCTELHILKKVPGNDGTIYKSTSPSESITVNSFQDILIMRFT